MNEQKKMPFLSEILTKIDRNNDVDNPRNTHRHQVSYCNSRTIIRYIESDVILTAYGCNPGNAVVIFEKKNGLIAYGCFLDSFPAGNGYPSIHWTKMKVDEAIILIKKNIWETADFVEEVDYRETENSSWEELAAGSIEYSSSYRNSNLTIDSFRKAYCQYIYTADFSILRLTSGKLRVEVEDKYFPYDEFLDILLFFQDDNASSKTTVNNIPNLGKWRKVLSIEEIDVELLSELKAQVIGCKMKEAA
ncbi:MAG: hypothetical protein Q7J16_10380 [Candidatus Cloacimonadales bacterium]|nr:hypothetical protein [Candidatus Cloacimonadales bacterium]